MIKQVYLVFALSLIPVWWIFQILWQPSLVHLIAGTDSPAIDRALEYATRGVSGSNDIFFTQGEISHLDDVSRLFKPISLSLNMLSVAAWSLLFLALTKKSDFHFALGIAAKVMIGLLISLSTGLLFFSVFFDQFHRLLFPQGNWAFSADSLLIILFPEMFWRLELFLICVLLMMVATLYYLLSKKE